jgi:predicted dehydrogenase
MGGGTSILGTDGTVTGRGYVPEKVNRPDGVPLAGEPRTPGDAYQIHIQNFLDCVRSGKEPNCPVELGFRVSIACRMAVDSYRQERKLRWDRVKEEIV